MRYHLCILFSFFILHTKAQFEATNLLPVKIDQKWGLINGNGTIVMEPVYDLIGTRFGSQQLVGARLAPTFVTVQLNNKIGLVNLQGQEALPPEFDEIIASFPDSIFTVKKDGNLLVVNGQGETIFDGIYEEVVPISGIRNFYIIRENGKYGLLKKGEGYIIPNEYTFLKVHKPRRPYLNFQTEESFTKGKYGLMNFENEIILPAEFDSIKMITPNHFLVKNEFVELYDSNQNLIITKKDKWSDVKILSKSFISFTSAIEKKTQIFSTKTNRFIEIKTEFDEFARFRSNFLLGKKDGKYGLIDTLGNEVIPPKYSQILHLEGDSLFKVKKFLWGVYKINEGVIATIKYDAIKEFNNRFANVEIKGKKGLINRRGEEVTPIQFKSFQFQEEFVKAFFGTKMHYYQADSIDNLELLEIYPEVYTLRIGYDDAMNGMPNISNFRQSNFRSRRRFNSGRGKKKKPDYSKIDQSDVEWYVDWGLWGLRRKSTSEVLIKPKFEYTRKLPFTDLTIVYNYDEKIKENHLLKFLSIRPSAGSFGIAFYSHEQEKFITDFEYLGVRIEDFDYDLPYARCLDNEGNYTLISQKGKQIKGKKTYNYIGDFYEGKARICIDGIPKKTKNADEKGYKITTTSALQQGYQIRFNRFNTNQTSDLWWIGGTWGFIDTLGNVVIPPTYEYVRDFENNTAICRKEQWGTVDKNNRIVMDFQYRSIEWEDQYIKAGVKNNRPVFYNSLGNSVVDWGYDRFKEFSEGFCAVQSNGKWGLVNEKGEEVLECKYTVIKSFNEGWSAIKDESGWYFIDSTLEVKLDLRETEYLQVGNFSEGLCWFKIKRNDKFYYGFLDKNGDQKISSTYTKAFDFQQGRARVVKNRKTGLIDKDGIFVMFPKKYDLVFPFEKNGIAQVRVNNMGDYGIINRNGKALTSCIYKKIFPFDNGYAKVVTPKGIGFIDTLGNEVISPKYRAVGQLSEGLVAVQPGYSYLWQYINMENEFAFKGKYSKAEPFINGKAIVALRRADQSANLVIDKKGKEVVLENNGMVLHFAEGKYGFKRFIRDANGNIQRAYCYYTDSLGQHIFDRKQFNNIEPFINNIGLSQDLKRKWGTLTHRGYSIIPFKFHKIFPLQNNMFSAISAELFGLYDADGNVVLEPVYDYIKLESRHDLFRIEQGSKIGYFATDAVWLWQMQD